MIFLRLLSIDLVHTGCMIMDLVHTGCMIMTSRMAGRLQVSMMPGTPAPMDEDALERVYEMTGARMP